MKDRDGDEPVHKLQFMTNFSFVVCELKFVVADSRTEGDWCRPIKLLTEFPCNKGWGEDFSSLGNTNRSHPNHKRHCWLPITEFFFCMVSEDYIFISSTPFFLFVC